MTFSSAPAAVTQAELSSLGSCSGELGWLMKAFLVGKLHSLLELGGAGEAVCRDDWKAAEQFHGKLTCPSMSYIYPKVSFR